MDYPGKVITKNQVTPTQTSATGVWTLDDAAAAVKNNNWPIAGVPNPISKSLRFNSAYSAYLNRTLTTPTNNKIFTFSAWVKRSALGAAQTLFDAFVPATSFDTFRFNSSDQLDYFDNTAGYLTSTQVFRDVGAWYHVMAAVDTTQATSSNRVKLYVNGTQITAFSATAYPSQNQAIIFNSAVAHNIGRFGYSANAYLSGYLTEVNFIDGQALTPSSFGMTDPQTGAWIPIKYTGTYGTNGFYLNFKDATSTTTLGNDYSGNSNNWSTSGFSVTAGAGNDSLTDVPTPWIAYNTTGDVGGVVRGNYATLNPISGSVGSATISNGNLYSSVSATSAYGGAKSTIGIAQSSGKWYFEVTATSFVNSGSVWMVLGLTKDANLLTAFQGQTAGSLAYAMKYNTTGAQICNETTAIRTDSDIQFAQGDVLQCAFDSATGKLWFGKNNAWFDSTSGTTGNPSAGTSQTLTTTITDNLFPFVQGFSTSGASAPSINFGQRPFAHTPPAGFRSLCTTNLPNPTIGTSTTTQAGKYMNVVLYTGNGATGQTITGVGFEPDFVWVKSRSNTQINGQYDRLRYSGSSYYYLASDTTNAELTGNFSALTSDGWTFNGATHNTSTYTYVGWAWKANGAGVTNTAGSVTSTVSANTTAGFSIVTWTGTSANATVGHGLGATPAMIIVKNRDSGAIGGAVYHTSMGATKYLKLFQTTTGSDGEATDNTAWNGSSPTFNTNVFSVGSLNRTNSSQQMVAYCFAAVAGYSAFGSYTGNGAGSGSGTGDGPFVYTGFRPRWIMVKVSSGTTANWSIIDTSRSPYNFADKELWPSSNAAEQTYAIADILSNGFKLRSDSGQWNTSGAVYIYAAFAEFPFKFANAR